MEANTQVFNTQVFHTAEPLSFPDSFFSPVDDFGDPFENQHSPGPSVNRVHSHEPPPNPRVKRRKVETRKVIKVPVPAESSDAEFVVPSDVWSWRKYGQKPIKGSPYPRGYYKCSSSKNCTAQKQVERSQTDRNMIIVTYISEHNHPCPTQKNPNVSKRKTLCNSIDSTSKESINRTTSSVVSTPVVVVAAAAKSPVFSAKIDESVREEIKGVELENIVTSSISEGHELDQVFENIGVDPLMGAMDGWDEIFPCFRGLDSNGLNISSNFFDDEWRID